MAGVVLFSAEQPEVDSHIRRAIYRLTTGLFQDEPDRGFAQRAVTVAPIDEGGDRGWMVSVEGASRTGVAVVRQGEGLVASNVWTTTPYVDQNCPLQRRGGWRADEGYQVVNFLRQLGYK
jgi:hypothetical protein